MTFIVPTRFPIVGEEIRAMVGLAGVGVVWHQDHWVAFYPELRHDCSINVIPDATYRQWRAIVKQLRGWN